MKDKKEMVYTIPVYRVYWGRKSNRAARAVRLVRRFIARHFGVEEDKVIVYNDVNRYLWSRGIEKPPRRVTVKAVKDDEGRVKVFLYKAKKRPAAGAGRG